MILNETKNLLSIIIKWISISLFCISYFCQPIQFYNRKTISGFKIDFILMNFFGHLFYLIFQIRGLINNKIGTGLIEYTDITIISYIILITIITFVLIIFYYDQNDKDLEINPYVINLIITLTFGALLLFIIESLLKKYNPEDYINFNCTIYLGLSKFIIDLFKYLPQIVYNINKKTSIGWNIYYSIFDCLGIVFFYIYKSIDYDKIFEVPNGQSKIFYFCQLITPIICFFYDLIFIIQHFYSFSDTNFFIRITSRPTPNIFIPKSNRESEIFS